MRLLKNEKKVHDLANSVAVSLKSELNIKGFVGSVIGVIIDRLNINLMFVHIDDSKAKGFSAEVRNYQHIYINKNEYIRTQVFTIAHEIYHLLDKEVYEESLSADERAADHFAACFLLPEDEVIDFYHYEKKRRTDLEILYMISDISYTPYETVYRRFKELSLATRIIDKELKEWHDNFKSSLNTEDIFVKIRNEKFGESILDNTSWNKKNLVSLIS